MPDACTVSTIYFHTEQRYTPVSKYVYCAHSIIICIPVAPIVPYLF